jgi:hypothetical protein
MKRNPKAARSIHDFAELVKRKRLYIDKTLFIEHFLESKEDAILITRPRRMGKSLNMSMLAEFLDLKSDSRRLFAGLKIADRPCFDANLNKHPVIRLNFKDLKAKSFRTDLGLSLDYHIDRYLPKKTRTAAVKRFYGKRRNTASVNLKYLIVNIHQVYGVKPIVLIDEYDKLMMDLAGSGD